MLRLFLVCFCLIATFSKIESAPKICLSLTVENEPELTIRCINSLKEIIDCVAISDFSPHTHSVKTIENFIQKNGILGKVFKTKNQSDSSLHTLALQNAQQLVKNLGFSLNETYLLTMDDHSTLKIEREFTKSALTEDGYLLLEQTPYLSYFNLHLLKASLKWENERKTDYRWTTAHTTDFPKLPGLKIEAEKDSDTNFLEEKKELILNELDQNPNDSFHLLILANIYKKLNLLSEAIDSFSRLMELTNKKEENWFSKYMLGVCYEQLNEWDQALFWYLEAFQTNPNYVAPLQKIVTYYRTHSQNDLAYLFAKHALKIGATETPPFYDSNPPQLYQLNEDLSISAFYTHFKEDGFEAAHQLTLSKNIPWNIKYQCYQNIIFYTQNLPFTRISPIDYTLPLIREDYPDRYSPMNPSILKTEEGYKLILRAVNYTQIGTVIYNTVDPDEIYRTKNFLLNFDRDFNLLSSHEIVDHLKRKKVNVSRVEGLEDCRIFDLNGTPWMTCTTTDTNPHAFQISACQLGEEKKGNLLPITKLTPLQGPDPHRYEKNWMPFVKNGLFQVIYSYDPFIIYAPNLNTGECKTLLSYQPNHDFSAFRGSAAPIEFDNGYLMMTHEVIYRKDNSRIYLHRFLFLDDQFIIQKVSKPFTFLHQGVEFCTSITIDHSGSQLVMPIGIEDREAYLCFISLTEVRALLEPLPSIH